MHYRSFGNTGMQVSEIGFGAWAIGGDAMIGTTPIGWGPVDDRQTEAAIRAALDAGINFFDTADIYGLGHSEDILGRVIGNRPGVIMASKGGNVARDNQFTVDYRPEHLRQACEASLKRLRRGTIDSERQFHRRHGHENHRRNTARIAICVRFPGRHHRNAG